MSATPTHCSPMTFGRDDRARGRPDLRPGGRRFLTVPVASRHTQPRARLRPPHGLVENRLTSILTIRGRRKRLPQNTGSRLHLLYPSVEDTVDRPLLIFFTAVVPPLLLDDSLKRLGQAVDGQGTRPDLPSSLARFYPPGASKMSRASSQPSGVENVCTPLFGNIPAAADLPVAGSTQHALAWFPTMSLPMLSEKVAFAAR